MDRDIHIEAHYRANYERLARSIGHRVGYGNSEDAVQEAYTRALKYWSAFDPDTGTFTQWFTSILNNAQRDILNTQFRGPADGGIDHAVAMSGSGGAYQRFQLLEIVEQLATEVEPRQQAIKLALVDGYLYAEVAEILPLSSKNVEKIVNRFRKKL